MKKVVLYSSNSKKRNASSNCVAYPKWADLWDELADANKDLEIWLVVQLNGRYFLDIRDGAVAKMPGKVHVKVLPMDDKLDEFVNAIEELHPDIAIAMPGPVSGIDWNGIRDAGIADELRRRGIPAICYSLETAMICFDKWKTHEFLAKNGFHVAKAVHLHHELFCAGKGDTQSTGNVYREYVLHQVSLLPFPVIIKGTTGSSSTGIVVKETYEEAEEYLLSDQYQEDLIIEEFLKGREFGTEIHGCKGRYTVLPPFMKFTTDKEEVIDPLGLTTVKLGPMCGEAYHVEEFTAELTRLAELLDLSGNNNLDLMLVGDKWYIIEINARWSGLTTLTTASEGCSPYDIYLSQYTASVKEVPTQRHFAFSCNFKMAEVPDETLERMSHEPYVSSMIRYEVIRSETNRFIFSDVVIGGFDTSDEMAEYLKKLQQNYPEAIAGSVATAVADTVKKI